jgi:hypothetical protein
MKLPFRFGAAPSPPRDTAVFLQVAKPWHAVSVDSSNAACLVCWAMKHKRFLSSEAPIIPIKGCTTPEICCSVYRHFDDRREGPRRTTEELYAAIPGSDAADKDRRRKRGRRSTDGYRW